MPCNLMPVGGFCRFDMSVPVGGRLRDMLGGRRRLCRHRGRSLAFCRSAALGRGHCRSAESAAKSESHRQFFQSLVHGRVPFLITRKLILALTQG